MRFIQKLFACMLLAGSVLLASGAPASAAERIPAIQPGEAIQQIKTLSWKASLRRGIKTKYGIFKAGTNVLVVRGGHHCIILLNGHKYRIYEKLLTFKKDLATARSEGDYNTTTKLVYANKKKRTSPSQYLIWVSLDKQRVNVFKGSSKNWKLCRVMKCSTGALNATPVGTYRIRNRIRSYQGLQYFMSYNGSGFHKWPGGGIKKIGVHTASHGCIRLKKKDSIWMFSHIPIGTKVIFY